MSRFWHRSPTAPRSDPSQASRIGVATWSACSASRQAAVDSDREPPYLHRASHRKRGFGADLILLPVPARCRILAIGRNGSRGAQRPRSGTGGALDPSAREAGSCRRQGGGEHRWRAAGLSCGGPWLAASLGHGPGRGRGSRGGRAGSASLTLARGATFWCPGDMMMDWVSPRLRGDAAAQSNQAVRAVLAGRQRADSGSAGAGRGCSPSVNMAVMRTRAPACCRLRADRGRLRRRRRRRRRGRPGCDRPGG